MRKNVYILIVISFIFMILVTSHFMKDYKEIDVVSSTISNNEETLRVVANRRYIDDKFALEVLQKYIDNSFHSVKLSTDLSDKIEYVKADVYLWEKHIENGNPVMQIEFEVRNKMTGDGIRENPEYVNIYIDGKEIAIR